MKKLLLSLVGLLFAVVPTMAQRAIATATGKVIKTVSELKAGYYLIDCYIPFEESETVQKPNGSLYYETANASNRPFRVHNGFITTNLTQGSVISKDQAKYLWQVEAGATNGTFKIKHVSTDTYLPKDAAKNNNMNNPSSKEAAELSVVDKSYTDGHQNELNGIVLYIQNGNETWSVFTNYAKPTDPNLSYWTKGGGGEVMFQFHEVTNVSMDLTTQFEISPEPTNGTFAEGTKWQLLTISNKYLYYTDDNTSIKVTEGYNYEDKYWWTFTKGSNGKLTIYNKAAGATKVLAAGEVTGNNGDGTCPKFVSKENKPEGQTSEWTPRTSTNISGKDGFYLSLGDTEANTMNLRNIGGTNQLSFWTTGKDQGSTFWVTAVPVIAKGIVDAEKAASDAKYVGTIQDKENAAYKTFLAKLNSGNPSDINVALQTYANEAAKSVAVSGKYFYLRTPGRSTNTYMNVKADGALNGINHAANNASIIWKFEGDEANGYTLSSQGNYVTKQTTQSAIVNSSADKNQACSYKLNKMENKIALWGIAPKETNGYGLHLNGSSNIVGWTHGGASEWYLIPATSIDVTITDAGYATINYPFTVQLPDGVKAYTGKAGKNGNQNVFTLTEVANGTIPANTPVVLEGAANTYSLTIVEDDQTTTLENNDLSGTLLAKAIPSDTPSYILGNGTQGIGFYKMNTTDRNLASNKAYLLGEKLQPGVANANAFVFSFSDNSGETTGIEESVAETATEEYFDLQGRRVMNPTKGIFLTKSGKKVLFY